jgi:hypothetical protein
MKTARERISSDRTLGWVALVAVFLTLAFCVLAARYADQQSLWVDESTQLAGLNLGLADQVSWLAGKPRPEILVPPDRAPPLSYFVGRAWGEVFGLGGETQLRWAGILSVSIGVLVLFAALLFYGGTLPAFVAIIFLALSPNVLLTATELRSYPFFFLFSCLIAVAYYHCASRPAGWLGYACLVAAALAASYTHFFGVVVGASALASVFLVQILRKDRDAWRTVVAGASFGVLLIGLVPFVLAATSISGGAAASGAEGSVIKDSLRLGYRLFAHQSMRAMSGADVAAMLAGLVLVTASIGHKVAGRYLVPVAPLAIGGVVVLLSGIFLTGFSSLAAHYNVWMLPFVAGCLGFGAVVIKARLGSLTTTALVGVLLASSSIAQGALWMRGNEYGHTRSRDLQSLVNTLGVERTTVLFDSPAGKTFFPMHHWFGSALDQYALTPTGWQDTLTGRISPTVVPRRCIIVAVTKELGASELVDAMWHGNLPVMPYDTRLPKPDGSETEYFPPRLLLAQDTLELSAFCREPQVIAGSPS